MRRQHIIALVVLNLLANAAHAVISTSYTASPGTGPLAGNTIFRFYAKFSSTSPEALAGASGLQSAKVIIDTFQPMKIKFAALNAPANQLDDADVYGRESSADAAGGPVNPRTDNANVGTFIRVGDSTNQPWTSLYLEGSPGPGVVLTGRNMTNPSANPPVTASEIMVNFATSKHLRIEGSMLGDFDPAAKTNSPASDAGSLFGLLVVPNGTLGTVSGLLAADHGGVSSFNIGLPTVPEPEPGTLGLLAVGAIVMMRRSWRVARSLAA